MPLPGQPPVPQSLKPIQHFLTIASEHDNRDVVVAYWCRMHALQEAMKIDKSSPEAKKVLIFFMGWLEQVKANEKDNEAITHEIAGQAHLENYALKLFLFADGQDRAGVFNKNVVKAFYTAGMLYSTLELFGELPEEAANNQKYAKWKAAYIHNCLKNGETPVPGPMAGEEQDASFPTPGFVMPGPSGSDVGAPYPPSNSTQSYIPPPSPNLDFTSPNPVYPPAPTPTTPSQPESAPYEQPNSNVVVNPEVTARAQKLCKYASSALNYDDIPTAITNLKKALNLLQTGQEE